MMLQKFKGPQQGCGIKTNMNQYTSGEIFTANLDCCLSFFPEASVPCTCSAHAHAVLFFLHVHDTHDICYWFLCLITSNPVSF